MYHFKQFFLRFLTLSACLMLVVFLTGCGHKTVELMPMDNMPGASTRTVQFSDPIFVHAGYEVTDASDPEQMIKKGLSLSEEGKHIYAAEYFMNVASHVNAPDNKLMTSALFAAANEYLMVGDMDKFSNLMTRLDKMLTSFDRSHLGSRETTLLAIHDAVQGKAYVSGIHPEATREIFDVVGH